MKINGLTASISTHQGNLEEHGISEHSGGMSCYIPAHSGQQFWLHYSIDAPIRSKAVSVEFWVDGHRIDTQFPLAIDNGVEPMIIAPMSSTIENMYIRDPQGNVSRRDVFFSKLDKGPKYPQKSLDKKMKDKVGSIECKVYRAEKTGEWSGTISPEELSVVDARPDKEHEYTARLGAKVQAAKTTRYTFRNLDSHDLPYAHFKFFYRSTAWLQRHGIMPTPIRPMSPLSRPLSTGPLGKALAKDGSLHRAFTRTSSFITERLADLTDDSRPKTPVEGHSNFRSESKEQSRAQSRNHSRPPPQAPQVHELPGISRRASAGAGSSKTSPKSPNVTREVTPGPSRPSPSAPPRIPSPTTPTPPLVPANTFSTPTPDQPKTGILQPLKLTESPPRALKIRDAPGHSDVSLLGPKLPQPASKSAPVTPGDSRHDLELKPAAATPTPILTHFSSRSPTTSRDEAAKIINNVISEIERTVESIEKINALPTIWAERLAKLRADFFLMTEEDHASAVEPTTATTPASLGFRWDDEKSGSDKDYSGKGRESPSKGRAYDKGKGKMREF